jgi:hypothetical protein
MVYRKGELNKSAVDTGWPYHRPGFFPQRFGRTVKRTRSRPARPRMLAAPGERSMTRVLTKGPRSTIVTVTDFPVARLSTLTRVPKASVRWAATMSFAIKFRPLAVCERSEYLDAIPISLAAAPPYDTAATAIPTQNVREVVIAIAWPM